MEELPSIPMPHLDTPGDDTLCNAEWGNCTGDPVVQFGKPSETPHYCVGPKRHIRKLHRCGCGSHGHCVMPTALSRAGRETKQLMDLGDRLAGMAAVNTVSELAAVKARNEALNETQKWQAVILGDEHIEAGDAE